MTHPATPIHPKAHVTSSPAPSVAPLKFRFLVLTPAPAGGIHSATVTDFEYTDVIATVNEKSTALQLDGSAVLMVEGGAETFTDPSGGEILFESECHRGSAALYRLYDKTSNQWVAVLGLLTHSLDDPDSKYVHGKTVVELAATSHPSEADDHFRPLSILIFNTDLIAKTPIGSDAHGLAKVASAVFFRQLHLI